MKVVINASRLASAGGLRVGVNLLKSFDRIFNNRDQLIFLCPKEVYSNISVKRVHKVYLPPSLSSTLQWMTAQNWVRKQFDRFEPDAVFNLCNIPVKTSYPQLLLIHWPYAVFEEPYIWREMPYGDYFKRKLKLFLIKRNYDSVDHLTVQTETMRVRAENNFLGKKDITVIPSSIDLDISSDLSLSLDDSNEKSFLYLSRYYFHKNHKILIDVAKLIKKQNLNFEIQVTIDKNNSNAKYFLSDISKFELHDQILNLGSIPQENIDEVFNQAYASINPSFLESFGLTYLEAASKNKLVLASNLDFAREIMQDAAIYFNPFNAESILNAMIKATDEKLYKKKTKKARDIINNWPTWDNIARKYLDLIKKISGSKRFKA